MNEHERERHRLYMREYRRLHPDRSAESRKYRERHMSAIKARLASPEYRAKTNPKRREWRRRPEVEARLHAKRIKTTYGISTSEYARILEAQGGGCYFCGRTDEDFDRVRRLSIDHDHATGRVRGIICFACNTSLIGADHHGFSYLYRDPEKLSLYIGKPVTVTINPSTERRRLAVSLWLEGRTPDTVAAAMGIDRASVYAMLRASVAASW